MPRSIETQHVFLHVRSLNSASEASNSSRSSHHRQPRVRLLAFSRWSYPPFSVTLEILFIDKPSFFLSFFLDELLEDETIQIVVANTDPSYVIKWMEFLGINKTRILRSRRAGHAYALKEAWLTQATPCVFGRRWPMAKLQQHLQPHVRKYQTKQKKHILIARRVKGGGRRSIPNWDEM